MRFVPVFLPGVLALAAPAAAQTNVGPPVGPLLGQPAGTLLSIKQLTVRVDPAGAAKDNGARVTAFHTATLGICSCADADAVAKRVGAETVAKDAVPLSALPPPLRVTVGTMKVGTATQMFGDQRTGKVSVLVLCARQ